MRRKNSNLEKKYVGRHKYASENPELIKPGTRVLDKKGRIRLIEEVSDKSLRLNGDNHWIHISEVRFQSEKEIERNESGHNITR